MANWLTILGMGLVTFGIRVLPFILFERWQLPESWRQALSYVPATVLMAIIVPEVLGRSVGPATFVSPRFLAALLALFVAWRWQNAILTVGSGMAALWLLDAFLPF